MIDQLLPITDRAISPSALLQRHGPVGTASARFTFDESLGRGLSSLRPAGLLIAAILRRAGQPVKVIDTGLELLTGTAAFVEKRLERLAAFNFRLFDAIPGVTRPWAGTSIEWSPRGLNLVSECNDDKDDRLALWRALTDLLEEVIPLLRPGLVRARYVGKGSPRIDFAPVGPDALPEILHPFNYLGPRHLPPDARKWFASLRGVRSVKSGEGWVLKVVDDPCAGAPTPFTRALALAPGRSGGFGYCRFPPGAPTEAEMPPEQRLARVKVLLEARYGQQPEREEISDPPLSVLFWEHEDDDADRDRLTTVVCTSGLSTIAMPVTGRRYEVELQLTGELTKSNRRRLAVSLGQLLSRLMEDGEPLVPNEVLSATPIFPFAAMDSFLVTEVSDVNNPSRLRPTSWLRLWPVFTAEARSLRTCPFDERLDRLWVAVGSSTGKPKRKPRDVR